MLYSRAMIGELWPSESPWGDKIPKDVHIFTAQRSYASADLGVVILSVCPSVCHTRAL